MRRVVSVIGGVVIGATLVITFALMPAMAQTLKPDPGPEEERMPAMTRTMRDVARDMERMAGMMERHQRLEAGCPALAPKER